MRLSINEIYDQHPYVSSFIFALLILLFILFYSSSVEIYRDNTPISRLEFVDINQIQMPKRIVKKTISEDKGNISESKQVERSMGVSEANNVVDLAFAPNLAPPKPLRRLRMLYPPLAKQKEIEAIVFVNIRIDVNGYVRNVHVVGARISKDLPPKLKQKMSLAFGKYAIKILMGERFSPTIMNGKKVAVDYAFPLKFRLNQ